MKFALSICTGGAVVQRYPEKEIPTQSNEIILLKMLVPEVSQMTEDTKA